MAKDALARGDWYLHPRDKNLQSLAEMGILLLDVYRVLRGLTPADYCEGPLADVQGRPDRWWVFGPSVSGGQIYVKIAVREKKLKCLSFHGAEWPLDCPLRPRRDVNRRAGVLPKL